MVGREPGAVLVQANAKVTTSATFSANCPPGDESLWSRTPLKRVSGWVIDVAAVVVDDNEVRNSPGCLPIRISKATTPKL